MREASEWTKATVTASGGVHLYIPKEKVDMALAGAEMPKGTKLKVKFYAFKSKDKGKARLMCKFVAEE